jgi:hypothetical protein
MKKLATYLAITAVVANMGVAAVFAQVDTATGTQDIDCSAATHAFGIGKNAPADFQIGSDGSRTVQSVNDTVAVEADNSGYFNDDNDATYDDTTDTLTISSNVPYSCGANGRGIGLSVSATAFNDGAATPINLMTYGSDGAVGGFGTAEDYYPIFSVVTSAAARCTGSCILAAANGGVESPAAALAGTSNVFAGAGPHSKTMTTGSADALLRDSSNAANSPLLYQALYGIEGSVTITGLDFNLMLPSNVETGDSTFTSTVTYTLTTPAW